MDIIHLELIYSIDVLDSVTTSRHTYLEGKEDESSDRIKAGVFQSEGS